MASSGNSSLSIVAPLRPEKAEKEADLRVSAGWGAVFILFILRAVLSATANLSPDEAYYWLWSTHLAWGYYDHPPMVAYWIRAGTAIFGQTEFGVRFVGMTSVIFASYLIYRTSLSIFRDPPAAALCAIWMNATISWNVTAIIASPDTPLLFFTALALFSLAKLIETGRGAWWLAIGGALGLAFMSKYTAALLLPCLLLWMLLSAQGRRWFARPEPYLGGALALLIVAPVIHWNYAHDWASFMMQTNHALMERPVNPALSVAELLGGQVGLATPLIFFFCLFGSFYSLIRGVKDDNSALILLGSFSAPIFVFFFIHATGHKIEANWPGFVYPAAILAAVHGFLAWRKAKVARPAFVRVCFRLAPWVGIALTLIAFLQIGLAVFPLESRADPTARFRGWAKLGADVERLEQDRGAAVILTDRFAITGELAFYGTRADRVVQINQRIRYASFPAPDETALENAPALLIVPKGVDPSPSASTFERSVLVATFTLDTGLGADEAYDAHLLSGYRGGLFPSPRRSAALASIVARLSRNYARVPERTFPRVARLTCR